MPKATIVPGSARINGHVIEHGHVIGLGIDPDKRGAVALFSAKPDRIIDTWSIHVPDHEPGPGAAGVIPRSAWSRTAAQGELMRSLFRSILADWPALSFVGLEVPDGGMRVHHSQSWLIGRIAQTVETEGVRLIEIRPREAKKALTGKSNASKVEMRTAARNRYGVPDPDEAILRANPIADACGIALATYQKLVGEEL